MAIKFYEGEETKKIIDEITEALAKIDINTFLLVRDVEKYGKRKIDIDTIMPKYAFPAIETSDIMLIEFSEKGVELGVGAGYAYSTGVPIYVIAKTGSDISTTISSLAEKVIFYDKPEELTEKFSLLIKNKELITKEDKHYCNLAHTIVEGLKNHDLKSILKNFMSENNDKITNEVRSKIEKLSQKEIKQINLFLRELLNYCYNGKLYNDSNYKADILKELNEKELFLLKENIIYYLGRLPLMLDTEILKKAYKLDNNKYIKLNLTFSSLITFDEDIEKDFVEKIKPGNEYDEMIRSWTMAFFNQINDPYHYVDNNDDWSKAKKPRIDRLSINTEDNPKFKKAMAFRLMDLLIIWLFLENRKTDNLNDNEKKIIENTFIEYPLFSKEKQNKLQELKTKILTR